MKKAIIWILCIAILACGAAFVLHLRSTAPSPCQDEFDLGMRFLSEGRYEDAILMFSEAISIDPNYGPAYFYRADAYLAMAENCPDPERQAEYLDLAEKDYIRAEVLDSSLASDAESRLEDVEALLDALDRQHSTIPTEAETQPETVEATEETTAPTEEATVPQESVSHTSGAASGSNTPSHNPNPTPGENSTPTDDPVIDNGEPPAEDSGSSSPEHNPVIPPVDDGDFMPDDTPAVDIPEIDLGEPDVIPVPDDTVDLGSPDTESDTSHSEQVTPEE